MNGKQPQSKFWLFVIGTTLAVLHLSLIYRSGDSELLTTCLLIWVMVGSLLREDRQLRALSSGLFASSIGFFILGILIFRCAHLPTSRMFLHILPLLGLLGLILAVVGWTGVRSYRRELLIFLVLATNPVLEMLFLVGDLSKITAIVATGFLQFLGLPAVQTGDSIHLFNKPVHVFAACSGAQSIIQMLNISILFSMVFSIQGLIKQTLCIGIGIISGFITNAVRVSLMVLLVLFSNSSTFDYWHEGSGSLVFSVISVLLFGIVSWSIFLRVTPSDPHSGVQLNG